MGIADIIPGVSGGTIALITGIYERLIKGISDINKLIIKELSRGKIKKAFTNILKLDFELFIPLLIGIALAFIVLSHLISYLLEELTAYTYAFFFGLILASAFFVYKQSSKEKYDLVFLLIGGVFAFWFVSLNVLSSSHSLIILFFSGIIGICAMILPGISGSFIMVLLGQYEYLINAIKVFALDKIGVFALGALIGILSFSKLLEWLLKNYKSLTMAFLTGIMLGSLRLPFEKMILGTWPVYLIALIGFGVVFILEKYS